MQTEHLGMGIHRLTCCRTCLFRSERQWRVNRRLHKGQVLAAVLLPRSSKRSCMSPSWVMRLCRWLRHPAAVRREMREATTRRRRAKRKVGVEVKACIERFGMKTRPIGGCTHADHIRCLYVKCLQFHSCHHISAIATQSTHFLMDCGRMLRKRRNTGYLLHSEPYTPVATRAYELVTQCALARVHTV
jgi:hypothetical protein